MSGETRYGGKEMKNKRIEIFNPFRESEFDEEGYGYDAEYELEYVMDVLKKIIDESEYGVILDGTVQTWQGRARGGAYAYTWEDFTSLLDGYYMSVSEEGKRVFLDLIHHDGSHGFELRRVTKKGNEVVDNNSWRCKTEHAQALSRAKCYTKSAGGWREL